MASSTEACTEAESLVDTLLCRVCGEEKYDLVSVFSKEGAEIGLLSKIHAYLPILVTEEDLLPQSVCGSCISKLEVCHQLITLCHKANSKLLAQLGFSDDVIDKEYSCNDTESGGLCTNQSDLWLDDNSDEEVDDDCEDIQELLKDLSDSEESSEDHSNSDTPEDEKYNINTTQYLEEEEVTTDVKLEASSPVHLPDVFVESMEACSNVVHVECISEDIEEHYPDENDQFEGITHDMQVECGGNMEKVHERAIEDERREQYDIEQVAGDGHNMDKPLLHIKDKSKFKVIVVKLTNTQNLPNEMKVSKALEFVKNKMSSAIETNIVEKHIEDEYGCEESEEFAVGCEQVTIASPSAANAGETEMVEQASNDCVYQNEPKRTCVCIYCSQEIDSRENLVLHYISEHPTELCYCSQCDVVCESKDIFDKHVLSHDDIVPQTVNIPYEQVPKTENPEQNAEISNIVNVDVVSDNPSVHLKVSDEYKEVNSFLKTKIVDTIQKIVAINNEKLVEASAVNVQKRKDWKCKICRFVAETRKELLVHKQTQHQLSFQCKFCNTRCRSERRLHQHERSHNKMKPFVCEYCGKGFHFRKSLTTHLFTHGILEKPYKCKICGNSYNTKNGFDCHVTSHSNESPYLCDVCGKSVKHISNFRTHRRLHKDPELRKQYLCDMCGKVLYTRTRLVEHRRLHTNELPLVCAVCGKRFRTQGQLSQHNLIHANARRHSCYICGRRFNRRGNMLAHLKRHDSHKCKICSVTFPKYRDLMVHLKSHGIHEVRNIIKSGSDSMSKMIFKCDLCNRTLSSKATLHHHLKMHSGEKPFACNVCNKRFAVKSSLTYHSQVHTGKKPYTCSFCNKGCPSKASLIVHERYHTGEKPFKCDECDMAFRSKVNLNQHRVVHSDERPFPCTHCEKRFRRRDALEIHLRIHTGERPYACEICGRRFRQKGDCNKHERSHLKSNKQKSLKSEEVVIEYQEAISCFVCGLTFNEREEMECHVASVHSSEAPNIVVTNTDSILPEIVLVENGSQSDVHEFVVSTTPFNSG